MSPVTIANYGKIQINKQEPYSKSSIQCFAMATRMSPRCSAQQGCCVRVTKDFCYFLSLKSKVLPIQRAFEDHYHLQAMTVVALAMLCKPYP
ncbi:hypothetical protein EA761_04865 [Acinetobacter pittii]|nr:hypothetical protein EA767_09890 [Acinetobacter pittii]RSO29711.1 hypothetical protein EA761_04865 [Acinetobacter pittii]RZG94625.1 hypothetical protein EXE03_15135 [Acinetobacter pittii]